MSLGYINAMSEPLFMSLYRPVWRRIPGYGDAQLLPLCDVFIHRNFDFIEYICARSFTEIGHWMMTKSSLDGVVEIEVDEVGSCSSIVDDGNEGVARFLEYVLGQKRD
jgi:hypothetical protein